MFQFFYLLIQLFFLVFSRGEKCQTLEGTWYSEQGSKLMVTNSENGILSGLYTPASGNELGGNSGTPGGQFEVIGAAFADQPEAVFSISITTDDYSIKSWMGQCLICEEEEVLQATWLLRHKTDSCSDEWQTTNIGRSIFFRSTSGDDVTKQGATTRRPGYPKQQNENFATSGGNFQTKKTRRVTPTTTPRVPASCSLDGYWYNQLGSEMLLTVNQNSILTGEYRTAVESEKGAAGSKYSQIYGVTNGDGTLSLNVLWSNGTSVTGWVGQCHQCGSDQNDTLLTSWILRSKVNSCGDNWMATRYGEDVFTRNEQIPGPRRRLGIDTPSQN